jgi:hypothetical protein
MSFISPLKSTHDPTGTVSKYQLFIILLCYTCTGYLALNDMRWWTEQKEILRHLLWNLPRMILTFNSEYLQRHLIRPICKRHSSPSRRGRMTKDSQLSSISTIIEHNWNWSKLLQVNHFFNFNMVSNSFNSII